MSGYGGKRFISRCQDVMMVNDIFLSGEYIGKGYVSRCQDMMVKDKFLDIRILW